MPERLPRSDPLFIIIFLGLESALFGGRFPFVSQSSLSADSENSQIIFSGGVYVGKDTSQAASVGPLALRAAA